MLFCFSCAGDQNDAALESARIGGGEWCEVDTRHLQITLQPPRQLKVPFDHMRRGIDQHVMVHEPGGRLFTDERPRESVTLLRAGDSREQRGFDQSLKVDNDVVMPADFFPRNRPNAGHDLHQLAIRRSDDPVYVIELSQRDDRRDGVNDVAERGQPDDEKALHRRRSLSSIAVVECSFGSPTMAIRPPYSSTTSRSGTESAE